ncbi:MAG: ABC transporter ATP-binding protein/permease [Gammaproteobacteria bacterium]|nr:ABC transporter ATP-binding protein/permease [Gammaproteobacteria bacterium]
MPLPNQNSDLRFLFNLARTIRTGIAALALLTLAQYGTGLAVPWISGRLTSTLLDSGGLERAVLDLLFAGLALALVVQGALIIANIRQSASLQMGLLAAMQARVYAHLQSLPLAFFHQRRTGALLSLLTHDAGQVAGFVATAIGPALPHVLTFLAALGLMMSIDWKLGAAAGLAVPLFFLAAKLFMRKIRPLSTALSESYGRASAHAESHLSAMLLIKAFNRSTSSTSEYAGEVDRVSQTAQQVSMALGRVQPGLNLAAGLFAVGLVWLLSSRLMAGALGPGELVSFLMYGYFLARPVGQLAAMYGQLQHARASAARIRDVLDTEPEPRGEPGRTLSNVRGEIEFRNVSFAYPERPPALNGIDLHIHPGETVALVGENGAGKTTLAHLLLRFADADKGEIYLDGENLKSFDIKSLRAQIGLVPQNVLLLDGSIAENIAFGREPVSLQQIESAARLAQAHRFIEELPLGFDTLVGERGVKLSGGQQQRIALARALLEDPPLLVLDEATAQFDPGGEANFLETLSDAFKDRTVLLITHRPAALAVADRIVQMEHGRIVHENPVNRHLHLA